MGKHGLVAIFEDIPDPRVERTRRHKLSDVLFIGLIGTIWGCEGWDDMVETAGLCEEALREILELPNGIPSADTVRRVFSAVDPRALGDRFIQWATELCKTTAGKLVAIDGKTVRGSIEKAGGPAALHLINAWVCENQLVLGQYATDVKSNEITAIPELLKLLDLRKATVSIDAMGCQKDIAQQLVSQGADYLFGLKKNQPTLHDEVVGSFDAETCEALCADSHSFHEDVDKGHGRLEVRRLWVQRDVDWLTRSEQWSKLRSLVLVESERTVAGKTSTQRRAYISSQDSSAEEFLSLTRRHWQVENNLHWVLDVSFGEDRARISRKNGAENLALMRKIALNLIKNAPIPRRSKTLKNRRKAALISLPYLFKVLSAGIQGN